MKKNIYILLGVLGLIVLLGVWNNRQMGKWEETLSQNVLPKLGSIKADGEQASSSTLEISYQDFLSSDGKFKIKYPSSWFAMKDEQILSAMTPMEWKEKYNFQTLFLAQQLQTGKFSQLMVQEGIFDMPIGEIIEKMKENSQAQGLKMEIVKSDTEDNKTVFEARYLMTNSSNLYSKEVILMDGKRAYLVAFVALENDWQELSEEADFILDSAQIVQ